MIATVDKYAPGFAASVIAVSAVTARSGTPVRPARRRYFSRRADAEQLFSARPMLATPITADP